MADISINTITEVTHHFFHHFQHFANRGILIKAEIKPIFIEQTLVINESHCISSFQIMKHLFHLNTSEDENTSLPSCSIFQIHFGKTYLTFFFFIRDALSWHKDY